jgi:tetratricopeptide (TPR) repeat protein
MQLRLKRRRLTAGALCAFVVVMAATAEAQTTADDLARRHFESGAAYLEQSESESALREFTKAYELSKRPEILINIATVHERLGNLAGAITALEGYLAAAPDGELAETTRLRLENLKKREAEEKAAKEREGAPPSPAPAPPPAAAPAAPPPAATAPAPAPKSTPSRVPAYVLLSVAGVTTAGAILTGVIAKGEYDDADESCAPRCSEDELSSGKTLALTSTILTGAALVSATIGAVLLFGSSSGEEQARSPSPRFLVGASPHGAQASARWRF